MIILFFIILNQIYPTQITAEETDYPYEETKDLPPGLVPYDYLNFPKSTIKFIQYIFQHPGEVISYSISHPIIALGYYLAFWKKIYASQAWEFASNTSYIEIGYGETVNINIGRVNMEVLNRTEFKDIKQLQAFMESLSFRFNITKVPGDFNESWFVYFNPSILRLDQNNKSALYKINVSISLTKPPVGDLAIQNGILRINQIPTQQYDSFWNIFTENGDLYTAFVYSRLFGKEVAGTTSSPKFKNLRYIDILVKVKPYHNVSLMTEDYHTFSPNQVAAIPISVRNEGNYKDTIGFKIVSSNKKITLIDPIDVTLRPGETKDTLLGVAVPPDFFEVGTLHNITIQAFSIEEPNNIMVSKTIILQTEGFYLSEYFISIIGGILFLFVIIYLFFYSRRKKALEKYYIKPEKPWDIPEEKQNLEKIKKKDKEKYNQTLQMMEDEYISAMLWYKDHEQFINRQLMKQKLDKQEKIKKEKQKESKKKEEKTVKLVKEKTKIKKQPKEEIKKEKIKKHDKPPKSRKKDIYTIEKEKAIQRIMRSQEKQRRKTGIKGGLE